MKSASAEVLPIGNIDPTTTPEFARLGELEAVIQTGLESFLEVGNALIEIREQRLYLFGYPNFDAYCRDRWGISRVQAHRLSRAAEIVGDLTGFDILPAAESQARPLATLPPEVRPHAWRQAVEESSGGQPTAKVVQSVVDRVAPKAPKPRPGPAPTLDPEAVAAAIEEGPAEPADIARQRRAGIIPDGVEVTIEEPGPIGPDDEDEPENVQAELSDAEWLATLPARPALSEPCRRIFDRDALLFRSVTPHRLRFHHHARRLLNANRKAGRTGTYHFFVSSFLRRVDPKGWLACKNCNATGQVILIGECPSCHGGGYIA